MKINPLFITTVLLASQLVFPLQSFATDNSKLITDSTTKNPLQIEDHIELSSDDITLNLGDTFEPEKYAVAYCGEKEILYGGVFFAIVNEVDTSKVGTYEVIYTLENAISGTAIYKSMTVNVLDKMILLQN